MNIYAYVGNNSLNRVDPSGLIVGGFGWSATGGAVLGGTFGLQIVVDHKGNIGLYVHGGLGGYVGASGLSGWEGSVYHGTIYDLNGDSMSCGVAAGQGFGCCAEGNFSGNWLEDVSGSGVTVATGGYVGTPTVYAIKERGLVIPLPTVATIVNAGTRAGETIVDWFKHLFGRDEEDREKK